MDGLLETINVNKKWIEENTTEFEYYKMVDYYTTLAAKYYQKVYPDFEIYDSTLTYGSYTYMCITIGYRPDIKRYCMFEYCIDSMVQVKGDYYDWNKMMELSYRDIQIIIDARASFNTKDVIEYVSKRIGRQYTFGIACFTSPSLKGARKKKEQEDFNNFINWIAKIEDVKPKKLINNVQQKPTNKDKKIKWVSDDFYKDMSFDDIVMNWKDMNYPRSIMGHPLFLACSNGDFMRVDLLLDTGMPYMTLDKEYLDTSILLFGVDSIPEEYKN